MREMLIHVYAVLNECFKERNAYKAYHTKKT